MRQAQQAAPRVAAKQSDALAQQTSDLESRLAELKQAMAKERSKRESLMTASNSNIWKSGSSIRGSARSKAAALASKGQPSATTTPSTPAPAAAAKAAVPALPAKQASIKASIKDTSDVLDVQQHQQGRLLDGTFDESDSHASFLAAIKSWRDGGKGQQSMQERCSEAGTMEVQTERLQRTAKQRPTSAAPHGNYFSKLLFAAASRTAGGVAHATSQPGDAASDDTAAASAAADTELRASTNKDSTADDTELYFDDEHLDVAQPSGSGAAGKFMNMLQQLELLEDAVVTFDDELDDDEEDEALPAVQVQTLEKGFYGMTATTRLPDAIVLPEAHESDC